MHDTTSCSDVGIGYGGIGRAIMECNANLMMQKSH